jgi:hypothetical protein
LLPYRAFPAGATLRSFGTIPVPPMNRRPNDDERHEPYSVEQYPATPGTALLVGYDGRGEYMLELRLPEQRVTARSVEGFRSWMRENDSPPLAIVR